MINPPGAGTADAFDVLIVGGGLVGASLAAAPMRLRRIGSSPKSGKAIPGFFGLKDREVNPRSSPCSCRNTAANTFAARAAEWHG